MSLKCFLVGTDLCGTSQNKKANLVSSLLKSERVAKILKTPRKNRDFFLQGAVIFNRLFFYRALMLWTLLALASCRETILNEIFWSTKTRQSRHFKFFKITNSREVFGVKKLKKAPH